MKNNLIGISGKIHSGKDLCFDLINFLQQPLSNRYSFEYIKTYGLLYVEEYNNKKFADKIKDMVCLMIGCTRPQLEDRTFKNKSLGHAWSELTPRRIMQLLGTEAGRKVVHEDIWVNALFSNHDKHSRWIITDVRFLNEVKAIKERGGIVIRINRPSDTPDSSHLSETSLDDYKEFDYVIDNSGSILDLQNKLELCLK